jgi:hypothetical protein
MRFSIVVLLAAGFLVVDPSAASGQVTVAAGIAQTQALGGQRGGDLRVAFMPPLLPVGFFAGVDYFFTDCAEDCSLWGYRIGGLLHTGTPAFQPFLSGGYVVRDLETDGVDSRRSGIALGVGLRVGVGVSLYGEVSREFLGGPLDDWVFRIGLGF